MVVGQQTHCGNEPPEHARKEVEAENAAGVVQPRAAQRRLGAGEAHGRGKAREAAAGKGDARAGDHVARGGHLMMVEDDERRRRVAFSQKKNFKEASKSEAAGAFLSNPPWMHS